MRARNMNLGNEMIRIVMAATAAAVLASACGAVGGGDKAAIIAACTKEGESQKNCECVANEFEKALDKDAFHAMALGAQGKEEEADKIMNALPMDKQMAMATAAMGVMMKCVPGAS
jgi:hypothetical protein